jgi:HK97 family phage major capsid protein
MGLKMSLNREVRIATDAMRDEGDDLIVDLAFASEEPYERWWGIEVLSCRKEAVRVDRLNDGASLLFNHNWDDLRGVHMPNSVTFDAKGVARCQVRITGATQIGRETIALVKSDVLSKVSTGYQIHKIIEESTTKSGEKISREIDGSIFNKSLERSKVEARGDVKAFYRDLDIKAGAFDRADDSVSTFKVVDWEPLENSLVTIPADPTVGVGRNADIQLHQHQPKTQMKETQIMVTAVEKPEVDVEAEKQKAAQSARDVIGQILTIGKQYGHSDLAAQAVQEGKTVEQFNALLVEKMGTKATPTADIGLTDKETKQYSVLRAIKALADKDWSGAGFERECHAAILKRAGLGEAANNGFYMPVEVQKRDLTVGTPANGGFLVATDNLASSFIDMLRNVSVLSKMGATMLTGLTGNVTIPKQTGAGTAVWLANEASAITEGQAVFAQLALTPKNVGAYTEISRQLMMQSNPSADALVMSDLAKVLGLAIDLAGLAGSGASGQPTGITNTAGIGSVTGTSLAYAGLVEFQTDVAGSNALVGSSGYVTTPTVAGLLKGRQRFTSTDTPIWQGNILEGEIEGYKAMTSLQIPAANMIFGDFSQVVIGEWGMLEIAINPYAQFTSAITGIRAIQTCDIGIRVPGAFSLATTIT